MTKKAPPWKPDQWTRQRFKDAWNTDVEIDELMERFGKTRQQVIDMRIRLGLAPRKVRVKFDEEGRPIDG